MRKIIRKYILCLVFSFDLLVLVLFSEMLRTMIIGVASDYTLLSISLFFLWLFGIVPITLLFLWLLSPFAIEKLFTTFGLTEKSLDRKKKSEQNENKEEEKTETPNPNPENLRVEYQVLNDTVNRRYRDMLLVESIMIPSTLVVVTFAIKYRTELGKNIFISGLPNAGFIPLISLLLLVFIWILRVTTNKINAISFERQRDIEKELRIKGHQYIQEQTECKTWFKIRWLMWHLVFVLLVGAYGVTAWWLFRETVIPPIP